MCLNKTYGKIRIGKHLPGAFPIQNGLKQGDALSPLLLKFALEYAIRKVKEDKERLELNGTHQLLVYGDDFEVLTAVSTKMAVFWVVAPCSLLEVYERFRGPCCLHHQGRT
jgi:hypothetical protein